MQRKKGGDLELFQLHFFSWEVFDELEVFLGGADPLVADEFGNENRRSSGSEVVGDKGVAKIINFGPGNAGNFEIAVDGSPNVADEEGAAGFSDEKSLVLDLGPDGKIAVKSRFGGFVDGDIALGMALDGGDLDEIVADTVKGKGSQFTDAHAGLKQELDNGGDPSVFTASVTQGAIFHASQNARRLGVKFGVDYSDGNVVLGGLVEHQKTIESLKASEDVRENNSPKYYPKRYVSLAAQALQSGEMSLSKYLEYLKYDSPSRKEAEELISSNVPNTVSIPSRNI